MTFKMGKEDKQGSAKGTIVALIIVIFIAIIIVWFLSSIFQAQDRRVQERLDAGCTPEAWDMAGYPTVWSCPKK